MDELILYTIGCPKCNVLEKKLDSSGLAYKKVTDIKTMEEKRYNALPILEINGVKHDFASAVKWVNERTTNEH